nr:zinc finger, CCHC-type [Tanacetum cinerariifolium]
MMKAMKLPLTFWAEAVKHAIYILNRVPTRALVDKTPYEVLYNRKPILENLRIFGCTAYAKITIPHLKKLDDRSILMIYLGVEEGSKACRLYDPIAKKKHVSRDVKFMETKPWEWDKDGDDTNTQDTFWTSFVVEGVDNENDTPVNTEINDNITYQEHDLITDPDSPVTPPAYTYNPNSKEEEEATISSLRNSKDRFHDTPVRGFKDLTEIYQNAREVETKTLLFTKEKPRNRTQMVYKAKRDAKGKIIKYKARLVAKGYVQEQGIDFNEVFAPVARIEIVRLILALAAYHGWQKQPTVTLSSCESEFMAATGAACQALWLKRLLSELTGWEEKRITLKVDNISAIALVRNPVFHGRSKHIDICYHFIREYVENGHINVEHVSGTKSRYLNKSSTKIEIPMDPGTKLVKAKDGNSVDATYYRSLIKRL